MDWLNVLTGKRQKEIKLVLFISYFFGNFQRNKNYDDLIRFMIPSYIVSFLLVCCIPAVCISSLKLRTATRCHIARNVAPCFSTFRLVDRAETMQTARLRYRIDDIKLQLAKKKRVTRSF